MSETTHSIYKGHLLLRPDEFRIVILFRYITNENQKKAKMHYANCNNQLKNCKCIKSMK